MSHEPAMNSDQRPDDDMLSCIICKSELRDPVLLQCLHNACSTCLDEEASRQGSSSRVACSACEIATDVKRRVNNSLLSAKIQYLTTQREAATCGVCRQEGNNEMSPDGFCIQCQQSLCVSCLTEHRKHVKQHKCVTFDDTACRPELLKIPSSLCNEHEAELSLACFTCERPLCIQCCESCYKGSHDVHILNTPAVGQRLQKIKERIERLIDDLDGSRDVLEILTKLPDSLQSAYHIKLNLYKQAKKAVIDAISTAFDKAVITLKDSYDILQDKASSYVSSARLLLQRLSSVSRYGRLVTSSTDAVGILSQLDNIVSHLSELKGTLSHLREPVETSRLVHTVVRLPIDLEAIACSWIRPPQLCTEDPCCVLDDLVEYNEDVGYITKEAQLENRIKDHEDLAKRQREEYDLQLQEMKNQEEKLQRQQGMQDEKEKSLKVLQAQLEKGIKDHEEQMKRQRGEFDRQEQQLRNREKKQQQQQLMQDDTEKRLISLREYLEKQKKVLQEKKTIGQRQHIEQMLQLQTEREALHKQQKLVLVLPVECKDVAVTADGHLLLAAGQHGMLEYDECGRQLSSWTLTETAAGGEDEVYTVDELEDGRVAVGLLYGTVLLLRQSTAARDSWQQEHVFHLKGRPWLLSVHAQLMAVAEDWQLVLLRVSDGRELLRHDPGYGISSVAATADAVITASVDPVQLSRSRKKHVVDSYSHCGQLLWRQPFSEPVYDLHWSHRLSVVYLALKDNDRVRAIRAVDGQQVSWVLNSSHGLKKPWMLSVSRGPRTVMAVLHYDGKTVTLCPAL